MRILITGRWLYRWLSFLKFIYQNPKFKIIEDNFLRRKLVNKYSKNNLEVFTQ